MSYDTRKLIMQKIRKARTIAIFMHNSPDGDCIGSAIAMEAICKKLGKNVDVIFHDKIHKKYAPIVGDNRTNKIIRPKEGKRYDIAILLDCADPNRTVHYIRDISNELIVIDHHPNHESFGDIYLYESECATGIIIYKIIKQIKMSMDPLIATALYFAVVSDTGFFKNSNTDSTSHEICGKLLYYGANSDVVVNMIHSKSKQFYVLLGSVINDVVYNKKHKVLSLSITRQQIKTANASDSDAALIIDYIKEIEDVDITLLFIEGISNVRIRARSKNSINVNEILSHFGGGGHDKAAGCAINNKSINDVSEEVIDFTINYIEKNQS